MQQDEVPQDEKNLNEGKLAKLYYATDAKGHYTKVNSIGWEPETVAMEQAWDVVHAEVEAARQKVISGKASPVLYFLKKKYNERSHGSRVYGNTQRGGQVTYDPFFL